MLRRPPLIVWRFTMVELWRLLLLTAAILVVVLAFAASVRFLADGRLGPFDTLRLMALAIPPMLQYALPFAAGFGATLAYHRMGSDNELTACYAGGVGHRALLFPALASGIILAGVVLSLSNFVIPRFLRAMEVLITRDAARLIFDAIERKEAVRLGDDVLVYADAVYHMPVTDGRDYQHLYLKGVFVVQLDKNLDVVFEGSSLDADVWLVRATAGEVPVDNGANWFAPLKEDPVATSRNGAADSSTPVTAVIMQPHSMVGHKHGEMSAEQDTAQMIRAIPNTFQEDPKFLTFAELEHLREHPEGMAAIDSRRRVLAARLAERATTDRLRAALQSRGAAAFIDTVGDRIVLRAADIALGADAVWNILPAPGQPVMVDRTTEGRVVRQSAKTATFRTFVTPEAAKKPVSIHMVLAQINPVALPVKGGKPPGRGDLDPGLPEPPGVDSGASKRSQSFPDLLLTDDPAERLTEAPSSELLVETDARVAATPGGDSYLQSAQKELRARLADLMREITSKEQERYAAAGACLVMIVTGAVMAMRLKGALPLTVYLWSFFPALGAVISISAGQQVMHKHGLIGAPVLWGGVAALAGLTLMQLRRVARN